MKKYIIIFCLFNNLYSEKIILNNKSLKTKIILELVRNVANFDYKLDENINSIYSQNKIEGDLDQIIKHILFKSCPVLELNKIDSVYHISEKVALHRPQPFDCEIKTECIENVNANFDDNFVDSIKQFWNKILYKNNDKQLLVIDKESRSIISTGPSSIIKKLKNYINSISEAKERIKIDIVTFIITEETASASGINWSGVYNRLRSIELFKNFSFAGTSGSETDIPTPPFSVFSPSFQECGNLYVDPGNFTFNLYPVALTLGQIEGVILTQGKALSFPAPNFSVPVIFGGPDLNTRRLNLELNAAENQQLLKVVNRLSVVVDNGEVTKIFEGRSVPYYVQVLETLQDSGRSTVTYFYRDIGAMLQVKPTIIDDEKINIDIFHEVTSISSGSSFIDFSQYLPGVPVATIPVTLNPINVNWTQMKNQLTLYNDQTTIINKFEFLELDKAIINVPYIAKLPIIGKFFTGTDKQTRKRSFVMLITAKIIK